MKKIHSLLIPGLAILSLWLNPEVEASLLIDFNAIGDAGSSPSVNLGVVASTTYSPTSFNNQASGRIDLEISGLDVAENGGALDTVILAFEVAAPLSGQTVSDNAGANGFGVLTGGGGTLPITSGEELAVSFLAGSSSVIFGDPHASAPEFTFLGFDEVVIRNPGDRVEINGTPTGLTGGSEAAFAVTSSSSTLTLSHTGVGGGFRLRNFSGQVQVSAVPEPMTSLLLGFASFFAWFGRRRFRGGEGSKQR